MVLLQDAGNSRLLFFPFLLPFLNFGWRIHQNDENEESQGKELQNTCLMCSNNFFWAFCLAQLKPNFLALLRCSNLKTITFPIPSLRINTAQNRKLTSVLCAKNICYEINKRLNFWEISTKKMFDPRNKNKIKQVSDTENNLNDN